MVDPPRARAASAPPIITLEPVACPKCGRGESHVVVTGKDYLYGVPGEFFAVECERCGFWYQNPRPDERSLTRLYPPAYGPHQPPDARSHGPARGRLTADYLSRRLGYEHLVTADPDHLGRLWAALSRAWIEWRTGLDLIPHYVEDGKLLDIGCGNGERLASLRQLGWRDCCGIELVAGAAEQARAAGFTVECGSVEEQLARFPRAGLDVIIASMLLEHLHDPRSVVREVATRLRPGGEFLFSTVTRDSVEAKLYGSYWSGFDFPRHMVYFRLADIEDMLRDDFEHVERFHENAPVDFLRSSSWRRGEAGSVFDRLVMILAGSRLGRVPSGVLARLGLTSRVSFRCRRRLTLRSRG